MAVGLARCLAHYAAKIPVPAQAWLENPGRMTDQFWAGPAGDQPSHPAAPQVVAAQVEDVEKEPMFPTTPFSEGLRKSKSHVGPVEPGVLVGEAEGLRAGVLVKTVVAESHPC